MPTRKSVKPKTEFGNTIKLEAGLALHRIIKQLLSYIKKEPKSKELVLQLISVAKILTTSARGDVRKDGFRIIKMQGYAPDKYKDEGVLRMKNYERNGNGNDTIH